MYPHINNFEPQITSLMYLLCLYNYVLAADAFVSIKKVSSHSRMKAVLVQNCFAFFALYDLSGNPVCKGKTAGNRAVLHCAVVLWLPTLFCLLLSAAFIVVSL
jgi:hypothetical protein